MNPQSSNNWRAILDWYHQTLIDVVRPVVTNNQKVRVVFFGLYGPTSYEREDEKYEKYIMDPNSNVVFMRLRLSPKKGNKERIKNAIINTINLNSNLVWDYEILKTFNVFIDLGNRYGSRNRLQTLRFIRYWDAACRYILSILIMPGNWSYNVDVWGIPHLVNNSLGCKLRIRNSRCPNCGQPLCLTTDKCDISPPVSTSSLPFFLVVCTQCGYQGTCVINI
jgi:hypothetical protein